MYFPVGWPKRLHVAQTEAPLVDICANHDRLLFAMITENSISLWYCRPTVQIVSFRRSDNSVSRFGVNEKAIWKPDSSTVAVTASNGYVLFYDIEVDPNEKNSLFLQKEQRRLGKKTEVVELSNGDNIPALHLTQSAYIQVEGSVTSMVCLREELVVATGEGLLQRIGWDGMVNAEMTISLGEIPFSTDLQHSRVSQIDPAEVHVRHLHFCPLLGGFAVVLTNGRAAFITANTLKFEPSQVVGVWAQEVTEGTVAAINHKYTLMAFGCKNGEVFVYHLDEVSGALAISHKLILSSKDFPDAGTVCGGVSTLKWTPDGSAIMVGWSKGGFSLWSVYGSLLLHSMGVEAGGSISDDFVKNPLLQIKSMEWGSEGYHLWIVSDRPRDSAHYSEDQSKTRPHLLQLHLVKSSLSINPCMSNHEHLFLQGEDKLYLNPEDSLPHLAGNGGVSDPSLNPTTLIGNKQWQIVPIPHTYLAHNWPVRFTTVNKAGHCVAVAGKTGLAHYALFSRKWKLFGNETQERDMVVMGGLLWWKDFICAGCYNIPDQRDEIRFYPRDCKLDNTFAQVVRVPSQILLLNTFRDILIALCSDCHIMIFKLARIPGQPTASVQVMKVQEVAIGNFVPHPANVIAVTMTSIRTETASLKVTADPDEAESIILNVAGRLLMFQRDRSGPQVKGQGNKERPLPFCAPVVVASSVENLWLCNNKNNKKPHLTEALWLGCGAAGMKVWIPLQPSQVDEGKARSFMSKRIMLPFHVDIYPLALLFESGVILGATSESVSSYSTAAMEDGWPYLQLERTSQVYLHHILRQLLRRNLGVHALDIARCCTDLPYFPHVLELLLHEVLEEEATSKDPIPDPLLPRVVAFVEEFPEFLQTVAHCARKSEVALWQYLFATVGNPKDLFEECLLSKKLQTAASYLIILQNLEPPLVARQHATLLLDAALERCEWDLARDLVRFLGSIDPSEAEAPHPHAPLKTRLSNSARYPTTYPSPPMSPREREEGFMYPRGRSMSTTEGTKVRHLSSGEGTNKEAALKTKEKLHKIKSDPQVSQKKSAGVQKEEATADQYYIDSILSRHARKLLSAYRIRDLACFAANLEDYQLVGWLRKEKTRAARIEDFITALKKIHTDFQWPLPILTLSALKRIESGGSLGPGPSLLDGPSNGPISIDTELDEEGGRLRPGMARSTTTPQLQNADGSQSTAEVLLQPQASLEDGSLMGTERSDTSSYLGEAESGDSGWSDTYCLSELEQLTMELANKGPPQSEVELRYLLQIVLEAGCLEWAMLIAVVLRDAMAVVRTVNTASMTDVALDVVGRMREGLSFLEMWSNTECLGYKPFVQALQGQSKQLEKIIEQKPPSSMTLANKRHSTSSSESGATDQMLIERDPDRPGRQDSVCEEKIEEEKEGEEEAVKKEEEGYECVLS